MFLSFLPPFGFIVRYRYNLNFFPFQYLQVFNIKVLLQFLSSKCKTNVFILSSRMMIPNNSWVSCSQSLREKSLTEFLLWEIMQNCVGLQLTWQLSKYIRMHCFKKQSCVWFLWNGCSFLSQPSLFSSIAWNSGAMLRKIRAIFQEE